VVKKDGDEEACGQEKDGRKEKTTVAKKVGNGKISGAPFCG
jgi:hypothetical protein